MAEAAAAFVLEVATRSFARMVDSSLPSQAARRRKPSTERWPLPPSPIASIGPRPPLFSDELCVPLNDTRSNYALADKTLIAALNIMPSQVYRMVGEPSDPQAAVSEYEQRLRLARRPYHPPSHPLNSSSWGWRIRAHGLSLSRNTDLTGSSTPDCGNPIFERTTQQTDHDSRCDQLGDYDIVSCRGSRQSHPRSKDRGGTTTFGCAGRARGGPTQLVPRPSCSNRASETLTTCGRKRT